MKVFNCPQRSAEWVKLHLGRPTASGFNQFMTTSFELRTGDMPKTYMHKRLAERVTGKPLQSFSTHATEHGAMMEDEAFAFFAMNYDCEPNQVGFILTEDERCGCSPDALLGEDSGLEIKCPNIETHIKYILDGKLPNEYAAQVHGSIYVTERKSWHFMSYCRGLPPFHIHVKRDESIMEKMESSILRFCNDLDEATEYYKSLRNKA